jgi:hypothetical protein
MRRMIDLAGNMRITAVPANARSGKLKDVAAATTVKTAKKRAKIKFGGIVVARSVKPSLIEVQQNISASTLALKRAKGRLVKGGVRIYKKKGVPLFYVDPSRPGTFIRLLDGKEERGVLENGIFKVVY